MIEALFRLCVANAVAFAVLTAVSWWYVVEVDLRAGLRWVHICVAEGFAGAGVVKSGIVPNVRIVMGKGPDKLPPLPPRKPEIGFRATPFDSDRPGIPHFFLRQAICQTSALSLGIGVRPGGITFPLWLPTLLFSVWPVARLRRRIHD